MSDEPPIMAPERAPWRVVCGQVGWGVFALAIVLSYNVVLAVFKGGLGQALHADPSSVASEAAAAIAWLWLMVGAAASAAVLAILGRRWILLTLAALFSMVSLYLATESRFGGS